jgi:hypothetical protein
MRTAVISVFVLLAASPAQASKSCMTMAEARAQFATSHLYWHGPNHCWDATAPLHRVVRRVRATEPQQADDDKATPEIAAKDDDTVPAKREPKWRNAMSEMLPVETPSVASVVPSLPAIATIGIDWLDRWVDVAQVAPPSFLRRNAEATAEVSPTTAQKSDPMVTPMRLILVFLSIVVILAVIELLFRNTIHERLD